MRFSATLTASTLVFSASSFAQTFTKCNPLKGTCPADPALGGSASIDFRNGASNYFTASSTTVSYGADGVSFTIAKSGDSPQLTSNSYLMFGKVEIVMKAAPGVGIVSSAVMQSDDLDEIDWEWLGADDAHVQTNYFGKGFTGTYNRGATFGDATSQSEFNTYTIDWTADSITWALNGDVLRTLTPAESDGQYPQTPMQIKIGAWSAGDPSNAPGTISWAGGPTNYGAGPYSMVVQSVSMTDYSTGSEYKYSGTSGAWQDIIAVGGSVYSGGSAPATEPAPASAGPQGGSSSNQVSSTFAQTGWPWVSGPSTLATTASVTYTTYPGLPSGWSVSDTGKVIPPSSAPHTYHRASPTSSGQSQPTYTPEASTTATPAAVSTFAGFEPSPTSSSLVLPTSNDGARSTTSVRAAIALLAAICAALML